MNDAQNMQQQAEEFRARYQAVREQIARVIVGHDEIVHGVLTCLFVGGHCLLEGVPGLGKTMLIRTLAQALDLKFSRIQFTPDTVEPESYTERLLKAKRKAQEERDRGRQ